MVCGNTKKGTQAFATKQRTLGHTVVWHDPSIVERNDKQTKGTDQEIMSMHDQNKQGYRIINLEDRPDAMHTITQAEQELNRLLQQDVALVAYVRNIARDETTFRV